MCKLHISILLFSFHFLSSFLLFQLSIQFTFHFFLEFCLPLHFKLLFLCVKFSVKLNQGSPFIFFVYYINWFWGFFKLRRRYRLLIWISFRFLRHSYGLRSWNLWFLLTTLVFLIMGMLCHALMFLFCYSLHDSSFQLL